MPVGRSADFILGGKPFMLVRNPTRGRSWQRSGQPDSPSRRSQQDARYGNVPDELDHPEVWDDFSGGFGDAYRDPARPNAIHWSENMDTRFPRQMVHCQAFMSLGAAFGAGVERPTDLPLVPAGGSIQQYVALRWEANTNYAIPNDVQLVNALDGFNTGAVVAPTGRTALFGSYHFVPTNGAAGFSRFLRDGITATAHNDLRAAGFLAAGNRLWRWHGPQGGVTNFLQAVADANTAITVNSWSATLSVGSGEDSISDVNSLNNQLFVGMPDGLYVGDSSGSFYNVLPHLVYQKHKDNCRDIEVFGNTVMAPHLTGLVQYIPSTATAIAREVGPNLLSNRSPIRGYFRCLKRCGQWLLGGVWTGSQSYILAGRDASPGLPFVWNPMQRVPSVNTPINYLHIDGLTQSSGNAIRLPNRLWITTAPSSGLLAGATIQAARTWVHPFPAGYGNPLNPDPVFSPNYVGSARVDFPAANWDAPGTPKLWRQVEIWAENLAPSVAWCDVYYTIDGGTRTLLNTAASSPRTTLYFPTGDGNWKTGQSIALSLESFTASAGLTPIYRSVVIRGALRARSIDEITALVRIADGQRDRQGQPMRPGAVQVQDLRDFAKSGTPQQLEDLAGATSWVNVLAPIGEEEIYQKGDDNPEIAATVKMAVLDFSSV